MVIAAADDEDAEDELLSLGFGPLPARVLAGSPASASVVVLDDDKAAQARIGRLNEQLLGGQALLVVDDLNRAVAGRVEAMGSARAAHATGVSGRSVLAELRQSDDRARGGRRFDLRRLLGESSFARPLGAADEDGAGGARGATVWGGGNYHDLSGGEDGLDWGGEIFDAQLGVDLAMRPNLLAGLSVSWSDASFDYRDGADGARGRYDSAIKSVHPCLGWSSNNRLLLWSTVGYGAGEIEIAEAGRAPQSSDTTLTAFSVGASGELMSRGDSEDGGRRSLRLKSEATAAEVEVEGGGLIRASTVDGARLRLTLEHGRERALSGGGALSSSLELGVRRDGGYASGTGVELGAGLELRSARSGLTVGGRGRALVGGSADEWGANLSIRLDPGEDGRGLSFSVQPVYGAAAGGVQQLWDRGMSGLPGGPGGLGGRLDGRMEAEIGYGLARYGGLLTPYGALSLSQGRRGYRAGGRFVLASKLDLNLEAERREGPLSGEYAVGVTIRWRLGNGGAQATRHNQPAAGRLHQTSSRRRATHAAGRPYPHAGPGLGQAFPGSRW